MFWLNLQSFEWWPHVSACPSDMAAGNQRKHLLPSFATKAWIHPSRGTHKLFLKQGQFRICSKSPNSFLGRQVHAVSRSRFEIQAVLYHKTKNPFEVKIYKKKFKFMAALILQVTKNSGGSIILSFEFWWRHVKTENMPPYGPVYALIRAISGFHETLTLKTRPSAKPFLWKWVLFAWE